MAEVRVSIPPTVTMSQLPVLPLYLLQPPKSLKTSNPPELGARGQV